MKKTVTLSLCGMSILFIPVRLSVLLSERLFLTNCGPTTARHATYCRLVQRHLRLCRARLLQSILREQGYRSRNLSKQIGDILAEQDSSKILSAELRNTIDAVRQFGNFSAHPITEENSLEVIDVEPNEAEWCLEIVEQLFAHYYIRPADTEEKLEALNKKLAKAGKPPVK